METASTELPPFHIHGGFLMRQPLAVSARAAVLAEPGTRDDERHRVGGAGLAYGATSHGLPQFFGHLLIGACLASEDGLPLSPDLPLK